MKLNKEGTYIKFKLLVLVLALVASSVTLWLLESPLKYVIYFFEVALIVILCYSLFGKPIRIKLSISGNPTKLDYAFPVISTILLVLTAFKLSGVLTMICAIIVSCFLPGYVLLRLLNFHFSESWIEWPVLSFALSIGLTSIIFTLVLPFTEHRAALISAIYVGISLCPLLKDRIYKQSETIQYLENLTKGYNLADVLLLLWITSFFLFTVSSLYPQMSLKPGLDIVRHFSSSRLLALAPDVYSSIYPWFHTTWATVYELSCPPMEIFQTGLAFLSIVVVYSFYIMARSYLKDVNERAPILSTTFFSVFAGFGWLYFLKEKLATPDPSRQLYMLGISGGASFMDVGYGQGSWLWLWFRPMTVSFTLFFALLYLLRRRDISKKSYIVIFSLMAVTLGFIHIPEFILFNAFLFVLVLFIPQARGLRLKEASLAALIGNTTYFLFACVSDITGVVKAPPIIYTVLSFAVVAAAYILVHIASWQGLKTPSFFRENKVVMAFAFFLALMFMTGLLTWLSSPETPSLTKQVSETCYIPLILYPVMFGVSGFLALHGFMEISKKHRNKPVVIVILLLLFTLVFSKFISFINVNYMHLGYGEKRFMPVVFATISIMAAVSFLELSSRLLQESKKALLMTMVTLVVISGIASTNLSIEYWNRPSDLSYYALDAIEYLSSPVNRDVRTPILTPISATRSLAEYIPSPYIVDAYRYPVLESRYPEIPLLILYNKYYPPPYLLLTRQDFSALTHYSDSYFTNNMLRLLPKVYSNPEIEVFKFPQGVPPSLKSRVVLVIPEDESFDYLYAYDVLSLGQYQFTTSLMSDLKAIANGRIIILPRDDEHYFKLIESLESKAGFQQENKEIIIFNFNGLGPLATFFFKTEPSNKGIWATQIKRQGYVLKLPEEVDVTSLTQKEDVNILAWYSNGKEDAPFAAELVKDNVRLLYINVYPIIKAGSEEEVSSDPRCVMHLLMGELEDARVKDVSMNGNDGLVYNAKVFYSPIGMCLDFNGNESFVEVKNSDILNPINEITIEAWIRPRTPDSGFTIVSKKAGYASRDGYVFLFDGGNFYFNFGNGTDFFPNSLRYGRLEGGQWYHLAVTYNGHCVRYYVNGVEVGSVKQSETIAPNQLNLLIGKRHDEAWRLNGSIYKIVMYNKALTSSEIQKSYNQTIAKLWTMNPISPILGSLIQAVGVNLPAHVNYENWVYEGNTAFFKSVSLTGNIVIKSMSLAEIAVDGFANVTILTEQGQIDIPYIKEFYITKTDYIEIKTNEVVVYGGKGFYARLKLANPTLAFHGETLITLVTSNKKNEITLKNGSLAILGQLNVYARSPNIYVNGEAKFEKMFSLFSLYPRLRSLGHALTIYGIVEFQLTVSDTYIFASNVKCSGLFSRDPPVLPWSEYESIRSMLPWLIVSVVLTVFWYAFFRKDAVYSRNQEVKTHGQ